jgi:hypothetical protein
MVTFKNLLSNFNFNYILCGLLLFSFFYLKNLFNKLINLHQLNIIILNKLCNKINIISKKNKKNYNKFNNKFNKKFKKNYKKIKKIIKKSNNLYLKNLLNNEPLKIIPSIPSINNIEQNQSNSITVDEENEFEILD